jgi:transcriptional regulator with XRE-family HTH domain
MTQSAKSWTVRAGQTMYVAAMGDTKPAIPADFGARVRAARNFKDWSQQDLADALNMSIGYIKGIETGKSLKGPEFKGLVEMISDATGMPRAFLLDQMDPDRDAKAQRDRIELALADMQARQKRHLAELASANRRTLEHIRGVQERLGEGQQEILEKMLAMLKRVDEGQRTLLKASNLLSEMIGSGPATIRSIRDAFSLLASHADTSREGPRERPDSTGRQAQDG